MQFNPQNTAWLQGQGTQGQRGKPRISGGARPREERRYRWVRGKASTWTEDKMLWIDLYHHGGWVVVVVALGGCAEAWCWNKLAGGGDNVKK